MTTNIDRITQLPLDGLSSGEAFRVTLSDALRSLTDTTAIKAETARLLGQYLQASRVHYADVTAEGRYFIVEDDYTDGVPSLRGQFYLEDYSPAFISVLQAEQTLVIPDLNRIPEISEEEHNRYAALFIKAFVSVPLIKGNRLVAILSVHQSEPRDWTVEEVALVKATAERTWSAAERARAENELRASETRYRTLFNSIDEGFAIVEMILDADGQPVDYRIVDVNPQFEKLTGLSRTEALSGKTILEIVPGLEKSWVKVYGRVALSREPIRFQMESLALQSRWYDVYAFPTDDPKKHHVAILYSEITDQKRWEANTAFLSAVQDDLDRFTSPDVTMQTVGEKIRSFLNLSFFCLANIDGNTAYIHYLSQAADLPRLPESVQLSDFVSEEFIRAARAAETIIVHNTQTDPRTDAAAYAKLHIHAYLAIPFHINEEWKYLFVICDSRARNWRDDEINVFRDVAHRVFPRLERARTENALREAEERLRMIIDSAKDYAIFSMDKFGYITSCNAGVERVFGYAEHDIVGQHISIIFTPEGGAVIASEQELSKAEAVGFAEDDRWHLRQDGSRFFASGVLRSVRDEAGTLTGFIKVARDATARHFAEKRMSVLQTLTAELAGQLSLSEIAVVVRHAVHRIVGDSIVSIFLLTADGSALERLSSVGISTEDQKAYQQLPLDTPYQITEAVRTGEVIWIDSIQEMHRRYPHIQQQITAYNIQAALCIPLLASTEQNIGGFAVSFQYARQLSPEDRNILITIAGICAQVFQRAQLFEAELEAQRLLQVQIGFQSVISQLGQEALTHFDFSTLLDRAVILLAQTMNVEFASVFEMIPRKNNLLLRAGVGWEEGQVGQAAISTNAESQMAYMLQVAQPLIVNDLRAETRFRPASFLLGHGVVSGISVIIGTYEKLWGILGVHSTRQRLFTSDDTYVLQSVATIIVATLERIRLDTMLRRSNEELQQFAYVASHDLQAPLRMVISYMELLQQRYSQQLDEKAQEFIEFAVDGAENMKLLISSLLAYSRLDTDDRNMAQLDMQQALNQALSNLTFQIEDSEAVITHDGLPEINADAIQITQLFQNLISNAIKFRNQAICTIHIGVQQKVGEWQFSVQDNGIGIEAKSLERIFQIFQRLHTREQYDGTGIGLAISKKVVERHGGRLWAESTYGQGTTFYFTIPL